MVRVSMVSIVSETSGINSRPLKIQITFKPSVATIAATSAMYNGRRIRLDFTALIVEKIITNTDTTAHIFTVPLFPNNRIIYILLPYNQGCDGLKPMQLGILNDPVKANKINVALLPYVWLKA